MQVCPEPPRSPTDTEACHIHDDIVDDWELTRTRYVGSYGKLREAYQTSKQTHAHRRDEDARLNVHLLVGALRDCRALSPPKET